MKPIPYKKAADNESAEAVSLVPISSSSKDNKHNPMDRFRRYEENFLNSSRMISSGLRQLESANGNVDRVIAASVDTEAELAEAEGYLRAMDVEFRAMIGADKKSTSQKVAEFREEYRQLLQNFQTTKHKAETQALTNGPAARQKLITANQRLDQSTQLLEQSRMLVAQTEGVGNVIMDDLALQKETLYGAKGKVEETKQFTLDAKGILKMMGRRAILHKIIMVFIILFLFAMICVVIYYGFMDDKKK